MLKTLIAASVALAGFACAATAQELAPHRAIYKVGPVKAGSKTPVTGGAYVSEFRATCEGYVTESRLRIELGGEGGPKVFEQVLRLTESTDGRRFGFETRDSADGRSVSGTQGEATLDKDGGEARFSKPESKTVKLPPGTLFPASIVKAAIAAARAGETGFDAPFFAGARIAPPHRANFIFAKPPRRLLDAATPEGDTTLLSGLKRIYFRAAFFAPDGTEPAFEVVSLTLDNGVETRGAQEVGDLSFEYQLTRIEALPAKLSCS